MRILAALPPEGIAVLQRVLADDVVLLPAITMERALQLANQNVDMILCGVHFDDSRMFDLLREIKADSKLRQLPFICMRLIGSNLAPALIQSLEISCQALGADKFI